jgi:hypothetical protein
MSSHRGGCRRRTVVSHWSRVPSLGAPSRRFVIERFGANLIDRFGPCKVLEDVVLKTRITEQYGLKVPFINAGMAFIATAPLVRARRSPRTSRAFASLTFVELEH